MATAPTIPAPDPSRQIWRLPTVKQATGLGRSHLYNLMKEGRFPQARKLGKRAVGWDSLEVSRWVLDRLEGQA